MVPISAILLALALALEPDAEALRTVAERSGYRATARYDEVVALGKRLGESSKLVHVGVLGKTVEERPIPLWVVADPPVAAAPRGGASEKLVVLLVGNIHAGEVCGKEALPMLARELTAQPGHPLLKDLVVAMVPIFNADGNERVSKDNRPGQAGPEEGMGERTNARGLDLNRDFMKLEAPETRTLVRFLDEWNPALVVDTHTTNGSFHRYTVTYEGPKNPAGDHRLIDLVRGSMLPEVGRRFEAGTDRHAFFYGNFAGDHSEWTTFPALPRFGTLAVYLLEPRSDDGLFTWNFFDDVLAVGGEVPVLRLPAPAALLTAPLPPLAGERPARRPITFEAIRSGAVPDFGGNPTQVTCKDFELIPRRFLCDENTHAC